MMPLLPHPSTPYPSTPYPSTPPRRRSRKLGAFTVMEMIVAVGAVALLSIAIAHIFRATGDTVRIGKRVSNMNEYASTIERRMRNDIASMSPGGFLVIRNELTSLPVRLHPDDPTPQNALSPRRIDELLFFATGDFVSMRDPVHPHRVARSSEARIYFGHGQKWTTSNTAQYYAPVQLSNANANLTLSPGLGLPDPGTGPDKYASDWILLRHVTLLLPPKRTGQDLLPAPAGGLVEPAAGEQFDSEVQVFLQPAATHIFRYFLLLDPMSALVDPPPSNPPVVTDADLVRDGPVERPRYESGIVDIATTSLAEIRAIILDAQDFTVVTSPFDMDADQATLDGGTPGAVFTIDTNPTALNPTTRRMHAWMREAFPARSDAVGGTPGRRMRCEPSPPDLLGVLGGTPHDREYKRTDQEMLCASNFVPHCTEFIVEWSFGRMYPFTHARAGQMIWHGRNDVRTPQTWPYRHPADPATAAGASVYRMPYTRSNGVLATREVRREIISNPGPSGAPGVPEYAYFGYLDPTYSPSPLPGEPDTLPWAWPKLIRITMSLVDPTDPLVEQTFQFIFKVPDGTAGGN